MVVYIAILTSIACFLTSDQRAGGSNPPGRAMLNYKALRNQGFNFSLSKLLELYEAQVCCQLVNIIHILFKTIYTKPHTFLVYLVLNIQLFRYYVCQFMSGFFTPVIVLSYWKPY